MESLQKIMHLVSTILDIDQNLNGQLYLEEFIKNISKNLDVKYVFIGHTTDNTLHEIETDAVWADNKIIDNFTYTLKDTPCEVVLSGERVCIHDSNVCTDFPDDVLLQEMKIEAYVGAPVLSKNNKSILVLLDNKAMENKEFFSIITEFLAQRAASEIEKIQNEEKLKKELKKRTQEINLAKQYEIIYKDNKKLLEYITIENNLQNTLDKIVHLAEKRNTEIKCSILLLDDSKNHLISGSAPSLPTFYNDAIEGIEIGDKVGSCGSAAFRKERVIVENIDTHENWQAYLELTQKANLHACWSEPIISSDNKVLGTFAIYNLIAKKPTNFEIKLIESYANLASKAIEKNNYTKTIKRNEQKLTEKQILLKNILTTIPDMVWVKDTNGKYLLCNQEFEKLFGKSEKEIIGKTDYDFFDKKIADKFRKDDLQTMKTEETFIIEEWVTYISNNQKVLLDTSKKSMYDDKGNVIGILGIGHDVTQRKLEKDRLQELNILAQSLTESQEVLLSLFDKGESTLFRWENKENWPVEYISQGVNKIFGFTKEAFLNKHIAYSDCIHQGDLERVIKEVEVALTKNLDYFKHEPYRIITKNGDEKWVLDHTATQKDEQNNITHFIGYITDITEQIKSQEMMFHQSKIASLGEMLGNIAHQWRQPLSIISTAATGAKIQKEYGLLKDEDFYKNMDSINDTVQYLSQTIDDFRNFFLADTSTESEINLENSIEKVLSLISDSYKNSNIEIVKNYEQSPVLVTCNENLFIQALINIFNNAKDALNIIKNKDKKLVFITLENKNNEISIKIKDNANGIPKDLIHKIFDPYFTTKHEDQGTGIGLYMTNQIITKHLKSEILVENSHYHYLDNNYKGALFTINIKL